MVRTPEFGEKRMELEMGTKCVLDAIRQREVADTFVIPVNTHMKVIGDTLKMLNYHDPAHFSVLDSLLCLACRVVTEAKPPQQSGAQLPEKKPQDSCWEVYQFVICMLCAHAHAHPEWIIDAQVSWHLAGLWTIYQAYPEHAQLERSMLTTALLDSMILGPEETEGIPPKGLKKVKVDHSLARCITTAITIGFILIHCDLKHPHDRAELLSFLGSDTLQPGLYPGVKVPKITVMDQVFYASTKSDHIFEHFEPWLIQGIVKHDLVSLTLTSRPIQKVVRNTKFLTNHSKQVLCKYFK